MESCSEQMKLIYDMGIIPCALSSKQSELSFSDEVLNDFVSLSSRVVNRSMIRVRKGEELTDLELRILKLASDVIKTMYNIE